MVWLDNGENSVNGASWPGLLFDPAT
jgi:hypothetical protein